jgi:hypothetical protein
VPARKRASTPTLATHQLWHLEGPHGGGSCAAAPHLFRPPRKSVVRHPR